MRSDEDAVVALGVIAKPHGLGGEVRLHLFNDDSDVLRRGMLVTLLPPDGSNGTPRSIRIVAMRRSSNASLLRLEGVTDREGAEALRGVRVAVPRALLGEPDEGEWYVVDLEGCTAYLGEETLGTVVRVDEYPTCDVLVIERPGRAPLEVPLLDAYVGAVDVAAGRVEVLSIDGLDE